VSRISVRIFSSLVTHLDGMPAHGLGIIEFRIPGSRILELRIAGLAAEGSESTDGLGIDSTGEAGRGRQALETAEHGSHARSAKYGGSLPATIWRNPSGPGRARSRDGPGIACRSVLIDDVNVAVAIPAGGPGEVGCVICKSLRWLKRRKAVMRSLIWPSILAVELVAVV